MMKIQYYLILCLTVFASHALAETRAVTTISAYNFPPPPSKVSKVVHTYNKGDVLEFKYGSCNQKACQVVTPGGQTGWIYEYKTTNDPDIEKAYENYKKAGFENWNEVDISVWYSVKDNLNKIDKCAIKIAHNTDVNRSTGWPAYCNTFENTQEVRMRVKEISEIMAKLSPKDEEIAKIKAGKIWIGAKPEHILASWGSPIDINTTVTSSTKREQWVYGNGNYVYVTNGQVSAIQN